MTEKKREIRPVRVLPEDVANKIAAGEVVAVSYTHLTLSTNYSV